MIKKRLKDFLAPRLSRRYLLRVAVVAALAVVMFRFVLLPLRIQGNSMLPTYHNGSVNICFRLRYLFSSPGVGDVVAIRLAGERILLLKRVVALAGDVVEFRDGTLYVNNRQRKEPYVIFPCDWDLPPRTVSSGHVYVVGDNRSVPMRVHQFGQTPLPRIAGGVLW
jgi:signal peptidase I